MATSGCYAGIQSSASVLKTEEVGEAGAMPTSAMSLSTSIVEVTGGFSYHNLEVFSGFGLGNEQVHQRTGTASASEDTPTSRLHFGISFPILRVESFAVRGFGIWGATASSILLDSLEENQGIEQSLEGGLQISTFMDNSSETYYFEPFFRLGYAQQKGSIEPGMYGDTFSDSAIVGSVGINFGIKSWDAFED